MQISRIVPLAAVLGVAISAAACQDGPVGPLASDAEATTSRISPTPTFRVERPNEVTRLELAQKIPGFGGYFYEDGNLVAYLTDMRGERGARAVLAAFLNERGPEIRQALGRDPEVVVRRADYEFTALREWREWMNDRVLSINGVVSTALSFSENRLVVGIAEPRARADVERALRDLGVPREAVLIRDEQFPERQSVSLSGQRLTDWVNPLVGGLKIRGPHMGVDDHCTIGFIAWWNSQWAFVTASHCSNTLWDLDNAHYFQPDEFSGRYVGMETHDPRGFLCGFMWVYRCRYSDAAMVAVGQGVNVANGYIARTPSRGSLDIDPNVNTHRIVAVDYQRQYIREGLTVNKLGARTGWTSGTVRYECKEYNSSNYTALGSYHRLLCQYDADYYSGGGDSGGPVYSNSNGWGVTLYGVHWGGRSEGFLKWMGSFSPMTGVREDLGTMSVVAPTHTPPPPGDCDLPDPDNPGMVLPC